MEKVNLIDWEKVSDKIDRRKYHIGVVVAPSRNGSPRGDIYVSDFGLYRRDMPWSEYVLDSNKPILSSYEGDTFEDLKEWVKENC